LAKTIKSKNEINNAILATGLNEKKDMINKVAYCKYYKFFSEKITTIKHDFVI